VAQAVPLRDVVGGGAFGDVEVVDVEDMIFLTSFSVSAAGIYFVALDFICAICVPA
jgi:hypothetical protein